MIEIVIPTCKTYPEIRHQVRAIEYTASGTKVMYSCVNTYTSKNRNAMLDACEGEFMIMLDDDIRGFYRGWASQLIESMILHPEILFCSAFIVHRDGIPQLGIVPEKMDEVYIPENERVLGACFALRRREVVSRGIRFDEQFKGWGYEDTDFLEQIKSSFGAGHIWVNGKAKVIHDNEHKNDSEVTFNRNKRYYELKHPEDKTVKSHTYGIIKKENENGINGY